MEDKININVPIDKQLLWEATLGGGWEYMPWWIELKYGVGGFWDRIGDGTFVLTFQDPDEVGCNEVSKTITIDDLAKAYSIALTEGYEHCGSAWDLEDPDACVSDGLLQLAFFGEITYG